MLLSRAGRGGLLGARQQPAARPFSTVKHGRSVVAHARSRRPRTDAEQEVPEEEQQQPEAVQQQPEFVRSSRGKASARRNARETRSSAQKLVTPHQALRDMGIIAINDKGKPFVDVSCLGSGKPRWYAIGLVENKETRYLQQLAVTFEQYGLSFDPAVLYSPPAAGDEAAAAAAQQLLESQDVVAWVPKKKMMVYSPNTDRLSERDVHYGRGTGASTLLLHMTLDPLLFDIISNTYYFLSWRDEQLVPAMLLYQADLLPPEQELDEVYQLPEPCSPEFLAAVTQWQFTQEAEDEEQKRIEFYGMGGGSTFGVSERYDKDRRNLEKDEAGNTIYRQGYAGDYNNPSRWSAGPGSSSDDYSGGRSRGRGGRGDRGRGRQQQYQQREQYQQQEQYQQAARGSYDEFGQGSNYDDGYNNSGRGRGRGRQQQQQRQQWQQQQPDDGGWFGGKTAGGRDDSVRLDQMDWMGEMGSGRYSDDEGPEAAPSGYNATAGRSRKQIGGRDDSWRQQQMSHMEEMGSGRYSDEGGLSGSGDEWQPPPPRRASAGRAAGAAPAGRGVGRAFGGTGDAVRQGQMSYMEDMGSGRYSDEDVPDAPGAAGGAGGWEAASGDVGGKDESVRERQMDFMGEMGSGRYSDVDDSGDEYQPPARAPRGQKQQQQPHYQRRQEQDQQKGSLMSEFAGAFEGLEANSDLLGCFGSGNSSGSESDSPSSSRGATKRNNRQRGRGGSAAAGPGRASYMEEDGFGWGQGDKSVDFGDEGPAAAKQLHDAWKRDGEQDVWAGYGGAVFDDQIAAVAGDDPLLQQLASMPDNAGSRPQQQRQQQQQAPGGRQQRQPAARGGRRGGRASSAGRGAGGRAVAGADGWKLAADGPDDADGFEDGWADRMMSDGSERVGLDDVMRS